MHMMRMIWWVIVGLLVWSESNGISMISGCLEEERLALLNLKASFKNENVLASWNEHTDCCAWEGVVCDVNVTTHRVIQLLLGSKNNQNDERINNPSAWSLNASHLLPLKQLQVLDLSENLLTDIFGLFEFDKLQYLDLSFNNMEKISTSLAALPSLTTFNLSQNHLSDPLLLQGIFCNLTTLEVLHLYENNFFGNLPHCLENLTSLQALDISSNNFGGTISSKLITSLTNIEYISLSNNHFEGTFSLSWLANYSKLQVFDLSCSNSRLTVQADNSTFFPEFQLKYFRVSWGSLNVIPSFLSHQNDLTLVDLSHNKITGKFPHWLLTNNKGLRQLHLNGNNLRGPLELNSTLYCPYMTTFDVSDNGFEGEIPLAIGFVFPSMSLLNMSKNAFQGEIPASIGNMTNLARLHLSSNSLSGQIPDNLLTNCVSLFELNLANNGLHGQILPTKSNLRFLSFLYLDNNHFSGEISRGLSNILLLKVFTASNNSLSGKLPSWIGNTPLQYLVLSQNQLDGQIPLCDLQYMEMLDLSQNNFNDVMPHCNNTPQWKYLKLQGNKLSGSIPNVLSKAASSLTLLDLTSNQLSGEIPRWMGSLSNLRLLLLKGNRLEGHVPLNLCQLKNLTILDLAHNSISGGLPSCFHDMAFGNLEELNRISLGTGIAVYGVSLGNFESLIDLNHLFRQVEYTPDREEVQFMTKFRTELYRGITLRLMSGIDLSSNKLTGNMPLEFGYLDNLHALNLSNNLLSGSIPESFSSLSQIESLDLSHNRLSGHIPSQLTQLFRLSVFSVAYNNLSGSTPSMVNQFGTFGRSSYEGNPFLCGSALNKSCSPIASNPVSQPSPSEEDDEFKQAFLWTFIGSFGIAFLGVIAFLYFTYYFSPYNKNLWFPRHCFRICSC